MVEQVVDELDLPVATDEVAQVEARRSQLDPGVGHLGDVRCVEERDAPADPDHEPGHLRVRSVVPADDDVLDAADLAARLVPDHAADKTRGRDEVTGDEADGARRARAFPRGSATWPNAKDDGHGYLPRIRCGPGRGRTGKRQTVSSRAASDKMDLGRLNVSPKPPPRRCMSDPQATGTPGHWGYSARSGVMSAGSKAASAVASPPRLATIVTKSNFMSPRNE
uniref:Unannotated protein n=1 Tax=freshwater metagenome TaxID=449393 RepID=A0A6J7NZD9_9ZZZZ